MMISVPAKVWRMFSKKIDGEAVLEGSAGTQASGLDIFIENQQVKYGYSQGDSQNLQDADLKALGKAWHVLLPHIKEAILALAGVDVGGQERQERILTP